MAYYVVTGCDAALAETCMTLQISDTTVVVKRALLPLPATKNFLALGVKLFGIFHSSHQN
jgi:hypothetical protein